MSLNNISLSAGIIADLYPSALVETGEGQQHPTLPVNTGSETVSKSPQTGLKFLGENRKNILVVVDCQDAVHLPDDDLQLLVNMLTACNLGLGDVAVLNRHGHAAPYKTFTEELKSRVVLLFGVEPSSFGLPMSFPHFQVQPFTGVSFLYSPSLKELREDKVLKSKLWVTLKRLFNI